MAHVHCTYDFFEGTTTALWIDVIKPEIFLNKNKKKIFSRKPWQKMVRDQTDHSILVVYSTIMLITITNSFEGIVCSCFWLFLSTWYTVTSKTSNYLTIALWEKFFKTFEKIYKKITAFVGWAFGDSNKMQMNARMPPQSAHILCKNHQ